MITLDRSTPFRIYLRGDTYIAREAIKQAGGHWDSDQKTWWLAAAKLKEAEAIAAQEASLQAPPPPEALANNQKILGRAKYKGKSGYLILWMGSTKRGDAAKLAFRDGSKIFWADLKEIEVEKTYPDREFRGQVEPGMTFGRLNRLADEYKQAKKDGITPCVKCGGIHRNFDRTCGLCGCTRCDGASGGLCEDD